MPNSAARDDYLASQIARHDEELQTMRELMCTQVSDAIEQGIMRAVSNPELWKQASEAIQLQAKQRAGGWLFGTIGAMFSKAGLVIMGLVALYTLGGPGAVLAAVKTWLAGGNT